MPRNGDEILKFHDVSVRFETPRAVCIEFEGDDHPMWLPLSQIQIEYKEESLADIEMPRWLAEEKGIAG